MLNFLTPPQLRKTKRQAPRESKHTSLFHATLAAVAMLCTSGWRTSATAERPAGPLIYIASAPNGPASSETIWRIARPMCWLPDYLVLNPHANWRASKLPTLRKQGILNLPPGPLFYNKERGTPETQRLAVQTLRRIHPDRRIGVFYTADESIYREAARGTHSEHAVRSQHESWSSHRLGEPFPDDHPRHTNGIEYLCDYTTVYGYQLTPDRNAHLRGVLAGLHLARKHTAKPAYLVTWTHIHSNATQMKEAAGQRQTIENWRWEVTHVWPHFEGVIVFAPNGIDEELSTVILNVSRDWAAGWIHGAEDTIPEKPQALKSNPPLPPTSSSNTQSSN